MQSVMPTTELVTAHTSVLWRTPVISVFVPMAMSLQPTAELAKVNYLYCFTWISREYFCGGSQLQQVLTVLNHRVAIWCFFGQNGKTSTLQAILLPLVYLSVCQLYTFAFFNLVMFCTFAPVLDEKEWGNEWVSSLTQYRSFQRHLSGRTENVDISVKCTSALEQSCREQRMGWLAGMVKNIRSFFYVSVQLYCYRNSWGI